MAEFGDETERTPKVQGRSRWILCVNLLLSQQRRDFENPAALRQIGQDLNGNVGGNITDLRVATFKNVSYCPRPHMQAAPLLTAYPLQPVEASGADSAMYFQPIIRIPLILQCPTVSEISATGIFRRTF
jgi:hypothetical protein